MQVDTWSTSDGDGSTPTAAMLQGQAIADSRVEADGHADRHPCGITRGPDEPPFDAAALVSGALRVVTVQGELDLATRHRMTAAVARACCPGADLDDRAASNGLLLNLAGLTFLDASGLSELRATHERAAAHGLVLRVATPAACGPRRLLRLAVDEEWLDPVFVPPQSGPEAAPESAETRAVPPAVC
jgi:anti-anti-sigma regulatory factor